MRCLQKEAEVSDFDQLFVSSENDTLLGYAKACRMNTEEKCNLFSVIMSANDYLDAFDRIISLGVLDQKLVISIIISCCLLERNYNFYYGALLKQFCIHEKKYISICQNIFRNKLKDIMHFSWNELKNLASLLSFLLQNFCISLSILQELKFDELSKKSVRFLKLLLNDLLLCEKEKCFAIFMTLANSSELHYLKDNLNLFMYHFFTTKSEEETLRREKNIVLKRIIILNKMYSSNNLNF